MPPQKFLLMGSRQISRELVRLLSSIDATWTYVEGADGIISPIPEDMSAAFICGPAKGASEGKLCRVVKAATKERPFPIFVVQLSNSSTARVRNLYREGATAVLQWPDEKGLLRNLVADAMEISFKPSHRASDRKLRRLVRAKLKASGIPFGNDYAIQVVRDAVVVSGRVSAMWKISAMRDVIESTPGVQQVLLKGLSVSGEIATDGEIQRFVRVLMKHAAEIGEETLAVAVKKGCVTISGTVRDRHESEVLLRLISHIPGVRQIDNFTVLSPTRKERDSVVAHRVGKAMREHFNELRVSASVFGGVAVLTGQVRNLKTRRKVEKWTALRSGINKVVNKVVVNSKPSR